MLRLLAVLVFPALASERPPIVREFPSSGLSAVEIRSSAGIIAVARADTDKLTATVTPKRMTEACGVVVEHKGGRVLIHSREKRKNYYGLSWGRDSCEADIVVRMPQHLEIDAMTGSGSLAASGVHAAVRFHSGSGSLRLRDCTGPLDAKLGSGSVEAAGLEEPVKVKTGSGSVTLAFRTAPEQGAIQADTGSGSIAIGLPEGAKAAFDLEAGSGAVRNSFGESEGAPLKVRARTGAGDISISTSK